MESQKGNLVFLYSLVQSVPSLTMSQQGINSEFQQSEPIVITKTDTYYWKSFLTIDFGAAAKKSRVLALQFCYLKDQNLMKGEMGKVQTRLECGFINIDSFAV